SKGPAKGLALSPERGHVPDKAGNVHLRRSFLVREGQEKPPKSASFSLCSSDSGVAAVPPGLFPAFFNAKQSREARYEYPEVRCRIDRNVLAYFCGMRQRGDRRWLP